MRVFALRAVLMLTFALLFVSAVSAGLALQAPGAGGDVTYMLIVCSVSAVLVGVALALTRGVPEPGAAAPPAADQA